MSNSMKARVQKLSDYNPKDSADAPHHQADAKGSIEPRYTLDELLEGLTDDNLHEETDTGSEVGREIE